VSAPVSFVRCSALPLAFACAASLRRVEVRIDPVNPMGEHGTAAHDVMHQLVDMNAETLFEVDLAALAQRHGVDEEQLRIAAFGGLKIWKQIRHLYPNAQGEIALQHTITITAPDGTELVITLSGHPDLLSVEGALARGGDWKFGRVDHDFREQMLGYCVLVFLNYPGVERVEWATYWMRESDVEYHSMTRAELGPWLERFAERIAAWDGTYRPGAQCTYCPRSHECPAAIATWKREVQALADGPMLALVEAEAREVPARALGDFFARVKAIGVLCDRARDAVRLRVEQAGGSVDLGDGTELRLNETNRRTLDVAKAWPVLQAAVPGGDMTPYLDVSLSKVESAVAKEAGRGKGAEAKRQLTKELEAVGALGVTTTRSLIAARKKGDE
jgi:hypothetical protein